jgi:hypothetical protein
MHQRRRPRIGWSRLQALSFDLRSPALRGELVELHG